MRYEWVGGRSGRENTNLTSHGETATNILEFSNVHSCRIIESMVVHESQNITERVITNDCCSRCGMLMIHFEQNFY
jgi:hypothetical protein